MPPLFWTIAPEYGGEVGLPGVSGEVLRALLLTETERRHGSLREVQTGVCVMAARYVWVTIEQEALSLVFVRADSGVESCGNRVGEGVGMVGFFVCTRPQGHVGLHAAHTDSNHVVALWEKGDNDD